MLNSLLPPNASKTEHALEQSTARMADIDVPNATLWNPATCPASRLPWLAWALSVDEYSSEWPIDIQRNAITQSVEVHKVKGTIGAVKKSVQAIDLDIEIAEQQNTPHTFKANLWVEQVTITPAFIQSVSRAIDNSKNARSHYTLNLNASNSLGLKLATANQTAIKSTAYSTTEGEENSQLSLDVSIASNTLIRCLGGDPQEQLHTEIAFNHSCITLPRLIVNSAAETAYQSTQILPKLALVAQYTLTQSVTECY
jgi:phage tail P2-like protein